MSSRTCQDDDCAGVLRQSAAREGVEITVSTQRPLVSSPYTTDGFVCPHGVAYWIEPTSEQIAQWAMDGTK